MTAVLNACYGEVMAYTALSYYYSYWASSHDVYECSRHAYPLMISTTAAI